MSARPRQLSIEDAARWTWAFFLREWALLLPVALAFIALPQVALELLTDLPAQPVMPAGGAAALDPAYLWVLPVLLVNLYGQLAIVALGLAPGQSVGGALRLAARRLGTMLASALLIGLGLLVAAMLLAVALRLLAPAAPASAGLYALLTVGTALMFLAVSLRLALLTPAVVARPLGPVGAIRRAFALSRGRFWTMAGGLVAALLSMVVVALTVQLSLGSLVLLAGRLGGAVELATAINTLVSGTVAALLTTLLVLFLVALYRQADQAMSGI